MTAVDPALERTLTQLVLTEARLLDDWQLDDWLNLFAEGAIYWVPIDEHADPLAATSIIYEDKRTLAVRVDQLMRRRRTAQTPRSRMLRQITNLLIERDGLRVQARSVLVIHELRPGDYRQPGMGQTAQKVADCRYEFVEQGGQWRIARKEIRLLDREMPQVGLSYLL